MSSVKIILRKDKKNKKGECPLFLRIIKHRKTNFLAVGLYLKEKDWDKEACVVKKSHRNSARLNAFISQKVADAQALIADTETLNKTLTSRKLKEKVVGIEPVDFFIYSKKYLTSLLNGNQIGTYNRGNAVVNKLKVYRKDQPLYITDIAHSFLPKGWISTIRSSTGRSS